MTMIPMGGNKVAPNPWRWINNPGRLPGHGLTAKPSRASTAHAREQADEFFFFASHKKAIAAIAAGKFKTKSCR